MNAFSSGAMWICGEPYAYGEHDTGYYGNHRNHARSTELTVEHDAILDVAIVP